MPITDLKQELEVARTTKPVNLADDVTPEVVQRVINSVMYYMREHADAETKPPFITMIRGLVQQVVIVPAKANSGVEHYVHVANASIRVTIGPIKDINMEFRIAQAFKHRAVMTSRFLALVWERKKRPLGRY